jgi:hypothetical protein
VRGRSIILRFAFETRESTFQIIFVIFGILITEIGWYGAFSGLRFPPPEFPPASIYMISFILWGIPAFLSIPNGTRRSIGFAFLILLIGVVVTWMLGFRIPVFTSIAFSYPGFFLGAAVAEIVVLFRRYVVKPGRFDHRWPTLQEELQSSYFKIRYIGVSILYAGVVVLIGYLFIWKSPILVGLFFVLVVAVCAVSVQAGRVRRRELREKKLRYL